MLRLTVIAAIVRAGVDEVKALRDKAAAL